MSELVLQLRITIVRPPVGVQFCLQRGKGEWIGAQIANGADLTFGFDARARSDAAGGTRLLGPYVQGPPTARFVYLCVGQYAGQIGSPWKRRIKVPLTGISWAMVVAAAGRGLEAAFEGTMKDGSPAAASVKLIRGWAPA